MRTYRYYRGMRHRTSGFFSHLALTSLAVMGLMMATGCKDQSTTSGTSSGSANGGTTAPVTATHASGTSSAPAGDKIVIGEYGSMTGDNSSYGIQTDAGIQIALDELTKSGGIERDGKKYQVEIPIEDDMSKPENAETAVKRLIDEKNVSAILGEVASSCSLAGGKICQQSGVPMISPSSTKITVTQIGDDIFRVCFIDSYQAAVVARFAIDGLKAKTAAIFTNKDQAYSTGFRDEFEKAYTRYGGRIVAKQTYSATDSDYKGQLTALKQANPDVILVPGYYKDASTIAKQARDLGITVPLLGGDGWSSGKLVELGGKAVDGCYFSDHMSIKDPKPVVQDFVKAYKAKYGSDAKMEKEPSTMAALGYDAAKILFLALKSAKTLDRKDIRDAIAQTKDYDGVTGKISINSDRNADKSAVIIAVRNGQFEYEATVPDPEQPLKK